MENFLAFNQTFICKLTQQLVMKCLDIMHFVTQTQREKEREKKSVRKSVQQSVHIHNGLQAQKPICKRNE